MTRRRIWTNASVVTGANGVVAERLEIAVEDGWIAATGGGIVSSMRSTRALDGDALMAEGVSTLEIKSGYGLDIATEITMLRTASGTVPARWDCNTRSA